MNDAVDGLQDTLTRAGVCFSLCFPCLLMPGRVKTIVINMNRHYKPLKDTKVVVITGHPEMLTRSREVSRVDLVLSKPVSNDLLLETIKRIAPAV